MALDAEVEIVAAQVADTAEHVSDNRRLETRLQSDARTRRSASMSRPPPRAARTGWGRTQGRVTAAHGSSSASSFLGQLSPRMNRQRSHGVDTEEEVRR